MNFNVLLLTPKIFFNLIISYIFCSKKKKNRMPTRLDLWLKIALCLVEDQLRKSIRTAQVCSVNIFPFSRGLKIAVSFPDVENRILGAG